MNLAPDHEVTAVDINPEQLAYAARRIAGAPMIWGSAELLMRFGRALLPLAGGLDAANVPRPRRPRYPAGILEVAPRHAALPSRARYAIVGHGAAGVYRLLASLTILARSCARA
jgi:hypothetical protein